LKTISNIYENAVTNRKAIKEQILPLSPWYLM
jgi:hypothetical protein